MNKFYPGDLIIEIDDPLCIDMDIIITFNSYERQYTLTSAVAYNSFEYDFTQKWLEQNYKLLTNIFRETL